MDDAHADPLWLRQARQWARIGSPLRPSREDVALVETQVARWQKQHPGRRLRALLLGVTPELATLRWPERTSLLAADRSLGMIAAVWPKQGTPVCAAVACADWHWLPLGEASIDFVVGDGAVNALGSSMLYASFTRELHRVLGTGGFVHLRTFVAPPEHEPLDAVALDLHAGRIGSFHALKWRIAMAVQTSIARGAVLDDVWRAWRSMCPDPDALAAQLGCDRDTVDTIHAYRGSTAAYTFPTLAELRAAFDDDFVERSLTSPGYELGERCPSIVFEAR